jgi:ERO1-like protein alpha
MDCVSCEKCRVWGKLQILGLGTAIKILLTPEKDISVSSSHKNNCFDSKFHLTRQEIIALINTLNQLGKSVLFSQKALNLEFYENINKITVTVGKASGIGLVVILVPYMVYLMKKWFQRRSQ